MRGALKSLAAGITALMLFSLVSCGDGNAGRKNIITGTFMYSGEELMPSNKFSWQSNHEAEFIYDDHFFSVPSTQYNHHLALLSLQVSMSAFGDVKKQYGADKAHNLESFLRAMEFSDIETHGYDAAPQQDGIAFTLARKSLNSSYELISVAIRGGQYGNEWSGNFRVGNQAVHESFAIAFYQVKTQLDAYMEKNCKLFENKKIKIWITGYSRGAAVANLLGAYFAEAINGGQYGAHGFNISNKDIFTYCFATPAVYKADGAEGLVPDLRKVTAAQHHTSLWEIIIPVKEPDGRSYDNIFNILNPNDPVPRFPFADWGFTRYGTVLCLPSQDSVDEFLGKTYDELKQAMLLEIWDGGLCCDDTHICDISPYLIDDFEMHMGRFSIFEQAIYDVGRHTENPQTQESYLDGLFSGLFRFLFGSQSEYVNGATSLFGAVRTPKQSLAIEGARAYSNVEGLVGAMMAMVTTTERLTIGLYPDYRDYIATIGLENERDYWTKTMVYLSPEPIVRYDLGNYESAEDMESSRSKAVDNRNALIQGHSPELYLAWMRALCRELLY